MGQLETLSPVQTLIIGRVGGGEGAWRQAYAVKNVFFNMGGLRAKRRGRRATNGRQRETTERQQGSLRVFLFHFSWQWNMCKSVRATVHCVVFL